MKTKLALEGKSKTEIAKATAFTVYFEPQYPEFSPRRCGACRMRLR
jgi:hypothetical protein